MAQVGQRRSYGEYLHKWRKDPVAFVKGAFDWGSGPLSEHEGPDKWQLELLKKIRANMGREDALRLAIASGHGVGKSAIVAWIILWAMCTEVKCRGVITANTESQLKTKTWAELSKWYNLCSFAKQLFQMTATSIFAIEAKYQKEWRIDAVPWSENKTEAFAGLHNQGRRIIAIYDEASAIPDVIWETTEGALTDIDTEKIWLVCGNPTRNTGRFRECFGRLQHRWVGEQVDSRTAKLTNKKQIDDWIKDYGEDSDFVRVRVRGVFPRAGSMQFISGDVVAAATSVEREAVYDQYDERVMGVDVARFGDDQSVITVRIGRDARSVKQIKLRGVDTMQLAARVIEECTKHRCDAIFVDGGGVGGGVVDRLRYLRAPVYEVQFGAKADRTRATNEGAVVYANKRAEIWGFMRDWLEGGVIQNDPELVQDLTAVEYGYVPREGKDAIQLEKKSDMKKRGLASPDSADSLALTFAYPVQKTDHYGALRGRQNTNHASEWKAEGVFYGPEEPRKR